MKHKPRYGTHESETADRGTKGLGRGRPHNMRTLQDRIETKNKNNEGIEEGLNENSLEQGDKKKETHVEKLQQRRSSTKDQVLNLP